MFLLVCFASVFCAMGCTRIRPWNTPFDLSLSIPLKYSWLAQCAWACSTIRLGVSGGTGFFDGGDKNQLNRLRHNHVGGDINECAVEKESGVERSKGVVLHANVTPQ